MRKSLTYMAAALGALMLLGACAAGTGNIAKSGNPELIYSTALKYYQAEKWNRAANLFEAAAGYYVGSEREDSIAFFCARSRFKHRDYHEASMNLDEFRRKFGRSIFIEDAEGMYALCQYYQAPPPQRDQTMTAQAIVALSEFIERYPESQRNETFRTLIDELTLRLHERNFLNAYTYFKIQKYKSAVVAFRNALRNYPDTERREDIMYYIVVSNYKLAHDSVASKQGDRYLTMLDSYYSFIAEYPDSKRVKELDRYAREAKNFIDKNNIDKQE